MKRVQGHVASEWQSWSLGTLGPRALPLTRLQVGPWLGPQSCLPVEVKCDFQSCGLPCPDLVGVAAVRLALPLILVSFKGEGTSGLDSGTG